MEPAMSDDLRTIEIDFDLHKRIETARESFSETPNDVLKRLLKMGQPTKPLETTPPGDGRPWSGKGVVLPHGTQLRMEYNGRSHSGEIVDGQWHVEGGIYGSPSAAAVGVAKNKSGAPISSLDGWLYWSAQMPNSSRWVPISALRKKAA
jgi:SeqA protein N-terminal domain